MHLPNYKLMYFVVFLHITGVQIKPIIFPIFYSISFKDTTNQAVTARLVKEVQALNSKFIAADIRSTCAISLCNDTNIYVQC